MARKNQNQKNIEVSVNVGETLPMGLVPENKSIAALPTSAKTCNEAIVAAFREGLRSYLVAGRLMRHAITSKFYAELGFKGSKEWLKTLPNSAADSYNVMAASRMADFAGVSDSYLSCISKIALYRLGGCIKDIESGHHKEALVSLLGKLRNASNEDAYKLVAQFKRDCNITLNKQDDEALHGKVPSGNGSVTIVGGSTEKAPITELSVNFKGTAFTDACKVLVHAGVVLDSQHDIDKFFAKLVDGLVKQINAGGVKETKNGKKAPVTETESADDAAYIASDAARIQAMNAVN